MKGCSTSLAIREMQIKTTVRYHLTLSRTAIINKSTNKKCRRGGGEKGIPVHCWWEWRLVQSLWKTVWNFLKKWKWNCLLIQWFHCWDYIIRISETLIQNNLYTSMFIAALFTIAKCWKQPKCPLVNEWIKNYGIFTEWNFCFYAAERKKELLPFVTARTDWRALC